MILAEKIAKLRKQIGWSQEELAEKMNVSRQSVSKWESANSIPDLNKIILLTDIFSVSTDYLLKDEVEHTNTISEDNELDIFKVTLEQASSYVDHEIEKAEITVKGVILCVCSVVPLFFLLAMEDTHRLNLTGNAAIAIGLVFILLMISIAVSFFVRASHNDSDFIAINNGQFELTYGVHGIFKENLKKFRRTYHIKLSISVMLFIVSSAPLMVGSIFSNDKVFILMMLIVLMLMIAIGLYIIVPVSAKYTAYNRILMEGDFEPSKRKELKRAAQLASFYFPLLAAIYLGWSFWTMQWGVTWIVWPVGAVLFAALYGLLELLRKEDE